MSKESSISHSNEYSQFTGATTSELLYPAENFELCLNVKRTWTRSGGCHCGQGS